MIKRVGDHGVAISLWAAMTLLACGSDSGPSAGSCEPGLVQACECPVGSGTQACGAEAAWGACVCPVSRAVAKPGVRVLGEQVRGFTVEGDLLSLPLAGNEDLESMAAGTIVSSFEGAGFLGRVVQVTRTADRLELRTEPVGLADAFSELDASFSGPVNLLGQLPADLRTELSEPRAAVSASLSGASLTFEGPVTATVEVLPASTIGLDVWVDFEVKLRPATELVEVLEEARLVAYVDARAVLATRVSVAGEVTTEVLDIDVIREIQRRLGYPAIGLSIPIGGGLAAYADVNFACDLALGGEVAVETTLSGSLTARGGIDWNDGSNRFEGVSGLDRSFEASLDAVEFEAYSTFGCALQPKAGVTFLGIANAYLQAGPSAEARLSVNNERYRFDLGAGLDGKLAADVSIDLEVIELNLFDEEFPLFDVDLGPLVEVEWSICGDGLHHLEEMCDPGPLFYALPDSEADRCIPPGEAGECTCAPGYVASPFSAPTDVWGQGRNWCVETCGDGIQTASEGCDDGVANGLGCGLCDSTCTWRVGAAHDGIADAACGEVCDDGNTEDCDACPNARTFNSGGCGDGILQLACGEECEPAQLNCTLDCRLSRGCGDGVVGSFEQCDDGNTENCDACHNNCKLNTETCGDGQVCGDEACDNLGLETYYCNTDCTLGVCGDGIVNTARGEECDDAGASADCLATCKRSRCGDRVINALAGEICDNGPFNSFLCDSDCTPRVCGDGHVGATEVCDDGDTDDCATPGCNRGCSGAAVPNTCGDGQVRCGETCDSGAANGSYGACNAGCSAPMPRCGDNTIDAAFGEACDDGNVADGDGCHGDCSRIERCGDAYVDGVEVCDDGTTLACAGACNETCTALYENNCADGVISGCEVCRDSVVDGVDEGCSAVAPNCAGCRLCSPDLCGDGIVGPTEGCDFCDPALGPCATAPMICNDQTGQPCTLLDTSACSPGAGCRFPLPEEGTCVPTCERFQACGNGFVEGFEVCDDAGAPGGCRADCGGPE